MNKDELDGLLALKLVAEKKNFTLAADQLQISPSAISQQISQLESRLGVALLNRTTRSTHLTEIGESFLSEAGPAIDQILTALSKVGTYAEKPAGLLRLNMPRSIYPTVIAPIVESFIKKYPEISVEIYFEDEATDMVEGGFDAGIRLSDILIKDMVAVKIAGPIQFVVAGSPKYLNKAGRPKHPKELLSHNCLRVRISKNNLYDKWEFEHRGKEFQVQVKGSMIFNDSLVMRDAAIKGIGLVYTMEEMIAAELKAGKLEIVLKSYSSSSAGFYLYFPKRDQVLPKLRAFIDHINTYVA